MEIIQHRINTIAALEAMPREHGAEIDLRTWGDRIILNHNPMEPGEDFQDWLSSYHHGTLILNVKEDGLEDEIRDLILQRGIHNAFFLDVTLPTAVRLTRQREKRFAVRFSEFETVESAMKFAGLADWCWLDCFTHLPLDERTYRPLRDAFKLCVVSPELEGHDPYKAIPDMRRLLDRYPVDAVCTDFPKMWGHG